MLCAHKLASEIPAGRPFPRAYDPTESLSCRCRRSAKSVAPTGDEPHAKALTEDELLLLPQTKGRGLEGVTKDPSIEGSGPRSTGRCFSTSRRGVRLEDRSA